MARNDRITTPAATPMQKALVWVCVGISAVGVVSLNMGVWLDATVNGHPSVTAPVETVFAVLSGQTAMSPLGVMVAILTAGVLSAGVWGLSRVWLKVGARSRVDGAANSLGRGGDIATLTVANAKAVAARLGMPEGHPGIPIGKQVGGGAALWASWEDMQVDIWGPRTGKTTARAIPAILAAPGSVVVTSNKRDVVDGTRSVRAKAGDVWVFDPQHVAGEEPLWWWNPLSYVTDEVAAAKLAGHFAVGSRETGAHTDAYFDPAGQSLLAGLLLAAALDERPILDVYRWLTDPAEKRPVAILRAHEYDLIADEVQSVLQAPEKQRGGVYGTAQQMASCLTSRQVAKWVNPSGKETRPQFVPSDFIARGGTLYSLSKEGKGSAGPLVTALTVAVVEAAEDLAARSPGGRLQTPLVGVLDEAANVCKWAELPSLYSHYGSRGIVLLTILQSWAQGVDVWGVSGMKKLWSASNIRVLGGGVDEEEFLRHLSAVIGDRDRIQTQVSWHRGEATTSRSTTRERILEVADLAQMPRGRAVVFASGSRPVLIRPVPWWETPFKSAVEASIQDHNPAGA